MQLGAAGLMMIELGHSSLHHAAERMKSTWDKP